MEALQILSPEVRGTSEAEGVCENGKLLAISRWLFLAAQSATALWRTP